jgi:hypothetical protein
MLLLGEGLFDQLVPGPVPDDPQGVGRPFEYHRTDGGLDDPEVAVGASDSDLKVHRVARSRLPGCHLGRHALAVGLTHHGTQRRSRQRFFDRGKAIQLRVGGVEVDPTVLPHPTAPSRMDSTMC